MDASIIMDGVPVPSPVEFFPGGLLPEVFSMTRGAYETLLRFLVTRIPNVRFVKGTVTGIQVYANDTQKIESVSYRGGEDSQTNITQKVQLLIGTPLVFYTICNHSSRSFDVQIALDRLTRDTHGSNARVLPFLRKKAMIRICGTTPRNLRLTRRSWRKSCHLGSRPNLYFCQWAPLLTRNKTSLPLHK